MAHVVEDERNLKTEAYDLNCNECGIQLAFECIESSLISDSSILLYSTDDVYIKAAEVYDYYSAVLCCCIIKDIACLFCGNIVGYKIVQPCTKCLKSNNNGHLTMFHSTRVNSTPVKKSKRLVRQNKNVEFYLEADR